VIDKKIGEEWTAEAGIVDEKVQRREEQPLEKILTRPEAAVVKRPTVHYEKKAVDMEELRKTIQKSLGKIEGKIEEKTEDKKE
jgi:hypothetical protein